MAHAFDSRRRGVRQRWSRRLSSATRRWPWWARLPSLCVLDELTPKDLWSVVIMHYREVVRTRQSLFAPISISNGRWYSEVSRLLLPLSDDGEKVDAVMGTDYARLGR